MISLLNNLIKLGQVYKRLLEKILDNLQMNKKFKKDLGVIANEIQIVEEVRVQIDQQSPTSFGKIKSLHP